MMIMRQQVTTPNKYKVDNQQLKVGKMFYCSINDKNNSSVYYLRSNVEVISISSGERDEGYIRCIALNPVNTKALVEGNNTSGLVTTAEKQVVNITYCTKTKKVLGFCVTTTYNTFTKNGVNPLDTHCESYSFIYRGGERCCNTKKEEDKVATLEGFTLLTVC